MILLRKATGTRSGPARIGAAVARLRAGLHDRRGRRELARLDERGLRDIGLTRSDVERLYLGPVTRPADWLELDRLRRRGGP